MFLRNLIRTKTFSFSSTVDMDWGLRSVKYESLSTAFKGMGNWWWYQITAIIVKDHQTWMKPPLCLVHWKPPKLLHCWNCKKLAEEEINAGAQCHEGLRMTPPPSIAFVIVFGGWHWCILYLWNTGDVQVSNNWHIPDYTIWIARMHWRCSHWMHRVASCY